MTIPDETLADSPKADPCITYTETSGASPDAPEETVVVPANDEDMTVTDEELNAALLLAQSNEALEEKPFVTENVRYATPEEISEALRAANVDTDTKPLPVATTITKKSYTLEIQPDITPAESVNLALFCFAQVLAQNPEVGITVNGMKFENFARHFKEMV